MRAAGPDAAASQTPAKRHLIRRLSRCIPMTAIAFVLAAGAAAPPANAKSSVVRKILALCEEGKSPEGFSEKDYIKATDEIEAYGVEYSECPELLEEAELAAAGKRHHGSKGGGGGTTGGGLGGGPGGGGGGGVNPGTQSAGTPGGELATTPAEQRKLAHARHTPAPVQLGHGTAAPINPGVVHADVSSALSSLPASLLAMIAALIAAIGAVAGWTLRARATSAERPS